MTTENKHKPIRKAYRSPTEDIAMAHVMRDWHRDQKRRRNHDAYLLRKAAWEATHPGKRYENRSCNNTQVWKDGDR